MVYGGKDVRSNQSNDILPFHLWRGEIKKAALLELLFD
jgi:hypothetical protein